MRQRHRYPRHIVPKRYYHFIDIGDTPELHQHYLVRYDTKGSPIPNAATFDSIKNENFSKGYFNKGWSTTLLGEYNKHDIPFLLTKRGKARVSCDWHHGDSVCKVANSDYEYKVDRGYFGLLISDVLNCTFDMDVMVNDKIERTDIVHYEIRHEPTHCIFWHFSVYAYAVNSLTNELYYLKDNKPSKNAAENATRNIGDKLKMYCKLSSDVKKKKIPLELYNKRII